jgi:uncharacterized membrane protein YbhN (UPF0104 family)
LGICSTGGEPFAFAERLRFEGVPRTKNAAHLDPVWVIAVGGLCALAAAVLLAKRIGRREGRWGELARGLTCMRSPSLVGSAFAWSYLAYLIDACEIWLVLQALGIDVPWATPALVLLGANLAIAVPVTPGALGALEAGIIAGLSIAGVPVAAALAFALVYHLAQLLPIVLTGLSGLRLVAEARAERGPAVDGSAQPIEAT